MARLLITSEGFDDQVCELRLGINRFGRGPGNDFQIEHPTISARHCEIVLGEKQVFVRDCESTNGTFIDGRPTREAALAEGQTLRLGDVEFLVENVEVKVVIPQYELPKPAPPVVLGDGSMICPRHPMSRAAYQCTECHEILCDACVHRLRRRGGKVLKLCPICSGPVAVLGGEKPKKKSLFAFLHKTVKLPFLRERTPK